MTNAWIDARWYREAVGTPLKAEHNGSSVREITFSRRGPNHDPRWNLSDTTDPFHARNLGTYSDTEVIGRVLSRWGAAPVDLDDALGADYARISKDMMTGETWVDVISAGPALTIGKRKSR